MPQGSLTAEPVISARGLTKRYGAVDALRGVDLTVQHAEIVAVLGPNGAGKTTLLDILEGFRAPTAGAVTVLGCEPARGGRALRERLGIVLQESRPEPGLTVRESLELHAGYYSSPRGVDETLTLVGLSDLSDRLGEQLSGGQQRRMDVALALIGDPDVVFLDEPTTGFDPSARRSAWTMAEGLRSLGKTIVLTTHHLEEAERLADRIVVLSGGRVVADATPGSLGGRDRQATTIRFTLPRPAQAGPLPATLAPITVSASGAAVLCTAAPLAALRDLAEWASAGEIEVRDLDVRQPGLEDVYLALTETARSVA